MSEVIDHMVASSRLERVEPNPAHALAVVQTAERHIITARVLAGTDGQGMAFTAAYDGARKALASVLAIEGLRVRPVGGAHRNTGIAAAAYVTDPALGDFDWMRQVRNATEYPDLDRPTATEQDVAEAIDASSAIIVACASYIAERT